ncbi:hypothetical protein EDB86DRAFT_2943213 [Lactarius hatsudake]|nr:hypothetical protein EDB86DRAFT_2943213 [Lactarius hatsudake]
MQYHACRSTASPGTSGLHSRSTRACFPWRSPSWQTDAQADASRVMVHGTGCATDIRSRQTTYLATVPLFASSRRAAVRPMAALFAMAKVQATLGISTLLYFVPVPLVSATHQTGSVAPILGSAVLHVLLALQSMRIECERR